MYGGRRFLRRWLAMRNAPMPSPRRAGTSWREVALARDDASLFTLWRSRDSPLSQLWWLNPWPDNTKRRSHGPYWQTPLACRLRDGTARSAVRRPRRKNPSVFGFKARGCYTLGHHGGRKLKKIWRGRDPATATRHHATLLFYGETLIAAAGVL